MGSRRISDDFWDQWGKAAGQTAEFPQSVKEQFSRLAAWEPYARPNHWPDADMLPVGQIGPSPGYGKARKSNLTAEEQRTMLTLWAIGRSPLILGANLTTLDADTIDLLTNRDLIRVSQTSTYSAQVLKDGDLVA